MSVASSVHHEGMEPNSRKRKILCIILINLAIRFVMAKFLDDARVYLLETQNYIAALQVILAVEMKTIQVKEARLIWRVQRMTLFSDVALMRAHSEREFTRRLRVKPCTFDWICSVVAPFSEKSKKGGGITLQNRVAISLARLGTGNYLIMCGDLYGMSEGTASIVVREFCEVVEKYILPLVVPKLTKKSLPAIAKKFEEKHGIPNIMGAIDCSHIAILAPFHDPFSYYNRKGFHSTHLQAIVDTDALFWDYDWGMAGSCHDSTVFHQSAEGQAILRGDYGNYRIIGDAAYPCRTWTWVPFKGSKEELPPFKQHWNFLQSSTRMCVERGLGMLKGRWRILLRKIEMPLENVGSIVAACICLHNLCILHRDFVDEQLHEEARDWLEQCRISRFGRLLNKGIQRIVDYGVTEIGRSTIDVGGIFQRAAKEEETEAYVDTTMDNSDDDEEALVAGTNVHLDMARNLYRVQLERDTVLEDHFFEEE